MRITLAIVLFTMAAAWAIFLFATHRAIHTLDWLPIAVLVSIGILNLRGRRKL
jgi:hypothetical protein